MYITATEWVSRKKEDNERRDVKVKLDDNRFKIFISNTRDSDVFRMIDLRNSASDKKKNILTKSDDKGKLLMVIAVHGEIDLVRT